jgi:hypothetical protein
MGGVEKKSHFLRGDGGVVLEREREEMIYEPTKEVSA